MSENPRWDWTPLAIREKRRRFFDHLLRLLIRYIDKRDMYLPTQTHKEPVGMIRYVDEGDDLTSERLDRLRAHMRAESFDIVICCGAENVTYATGYRSAPASHRRAQRMMALVLPDELVLIAPDAESEAVRDSGAPIDDFVGYGTFYFAESGPRGHDFRSPAAAGSFSAAVRHVLARLDVAGSTVGVDEADLSYDIRHEVDACSNKWTPVSAWLHGVRANKTAAETTRLLAAAEIAEHGVTTAIDRIHEGITERELASLVARTMVEAGAAPRFIVVTAGLRSALSDAIATDNSVRDGDIIRFDVGCTVDGYSSDIARTAVFGQPSSKHESTYDALLAGLRAQIELLKPGVTSRELFHTAVSAVEASGLNPYRRNHCGHGIGMDTYEGFAIASQDEHVLEVGNTLCLETPYYEIGWGGMMVEDMFVITDSGSERLTKSPQELYVVR